MKPEIEDGMGFSGLVSTRAEREQDKRDQAERKRIKGMEARIAELEADLETQTAMTVRALAQRDTAEAELAWARDLIGQSMNRIDGEPGTINHDLNKRLADFLVLKAEYRPARCSPSRPENLSIGSAPSDEVGNGK
jgi:hypothetical protein